MSRRLDRLVYDLLKALGLEGLQGGVCRAVGAGDVLAELRRVVGRLHKHLAGTKAGLAGQPGGLVPRQTQRNGTGNQVLNHVEEVGWAGARQAGDDVEELLLVNPLGRLADARQQRRNKLLLVRGDILARKEARGALADQRGGVRHDADHVRRSSVARLGPVAQAVEGDASGDADDDGKGGARRPGGPELLGDGLCDLGLDGDDDDVGVLGSLDVGGGGAHPGSGELVAVDLPGLGDVDVLLVDALGNEAADDGASHVAAADEGQLAFLESWSHFVELLPVAGEQVGGRGGLRARTVAERGGSRAAGEVSFCFETSRMAVAMAIVINNGWIGSCVWSKNLSPWPVVDDPAIGGATGTDSTDSGHDSGFGGYRRLNSGAPQAGLSLWKRCQAANYASPHLNTTVWHQGQCYRSV